MLCHNNYVFLFTGCQHAAVSDAQSFDINYGRHGGASMLQFSGLPDVAAQFHLQGLLLHGPNSQYSAPRLAFRRGAYCPCP